MDVSKGVKNAAGTRFGIAPRPMLKRLYVSFN
jgi:hypothetical protein